VDGRGGGARLQRDRLPGSLVLVDETGVTILDWENSGWGDPCFDVGDLVASPKLLGRDVEELEQLIELHAERLGDARLAARTRAHARLMVAWWVVRLQQELSAPTPRLEGVHRPDERTMEELLASYERWATELFGT